MRMVVGAAAASERHYVMSLDPQPVPVEFTREEAIVLFELTTRFTNTNRLEIADQAEQRALWNLCCLLEKVLVEPFDTRYPELLAEARQKLRDEGAT